MIQVKLPIYDRVHEDYLRYRFDSWEPGPIKISASHPIGAGIVAAVRGRTKAFVEKPGVDYLDLLIPDKSELISNRRYLHHYISVEESMRIRFILSMEYYTEVNRWIIVGMRRRLDLKQSINWFIDALQLLAPYDLHINYEQIRKMISRDMKHSFRIVSEMNKNTVYKSFV